MFLYSTPPTFGVDEEELRLLILAVESQIIMYLVNRASSGVAAIVQTPITLNVRRYFKNLGKAYT
jgi:hypothetical protein